jgi:hypothetical protein
MPIFRLPINNVAANAIIALRRTDSTDNP